MKNTPEITIECHSEYGPIEHARFSANWQDGTYRYHTWISIRSRIDDKPVLYPVKMEDTFYKNPIADDRRYNTKHLSFSSKVNAHLKYAIKQLATYDALVAIFEARKQACKAQDDMRAEADSLNRLYDALRLVDFSTFEEREAVGYFKGSWKR